jgi:hypothetical protein
MDKFDKFDDFTIGPQIDEFEDVNEFDLDFDEPNDDEYYEEGSELFMDDFSNIEGVIDDISTDLDLTDPQEKALYDKLVEAWKDPKVLEEVKSICIDRVCDNDTISNYISDYTVSELGDMDGIWNTFGDILRETIYEYFM